MRRTLTPVIVSAATLGLVTACSGSASDTTSTITTTVTAGSSPSGTSSSSSSATTPSSQTSSSSSSSSPAARKAGDDIVSKPPAKSWNEALKKATSASAGSPVKIELEPRDDATLEYKIVLISPDTKYVVQYDADTLDTTYDKKIRIGGNGNRPKITFDASSLIGLDKAAGIARGTQPGVITSWKLINENPNVVKYEFDILPKGASDDREIQVNAKTGSVSRDD